ncbi:beta strand repeat-containing protein [Anaerobiospirillum succiniciproducens]|uniref:beta strand repeat-containing protein n=1 Tax=Anaerobiospirillum succiniciproducens TaxID=13335 RepID=UPI003F8A17DC
MKQTNNAIKFLMAQYRAIFKNANIAMFAAIAAAALAAGQAQAATTGWGDLASGDKVSSDVTISGSGAVTNSGGFDLTVTSGTLTFEGSGSAANFTLAQGKTGTITIDGEQAKLAIGSSGKSGATVAVTSLSVNKGEATVGGFDQTNSLTAGAITIGTAPVATPPAEGGTKAAAAATAKVTIGKSGSLVASGDGSTFTIYSNGELAFSNTATDASSTVTAKTLNLNGGKISVANSGSATISGSIAADAGTIDIGGDKNDTGLKVTGNVAFTNGGALTIAKSGTLTVADAANHVTLDLGTATVSNAGKVVLSVADAKTATVKVSAEQYAELFKGVVSGSGAGNGSKLVLNITGDKEVDLVTVLNDGAVDNAKLALSSGDIIINADKARYVAHNELKQSGRFGTLTAGSGSALTILGATVEIGKQLSIDGGATSGTLTISGSGNLVLNGTGIENDVQAKSITVSGDNASLSVTGGTWSVNSLTMSSGSATIDNGSTLSINGDLTTTGDSGSIVVNNASTLDASAATKLTLKSGSNTKPTLDIKSGSTLELKADQVFTISGDTAALTSGSNGGSTVDTQSIQVSADSVLNFVVADGFKISEAQLNSLISTLGGSKDNQLKGFISFADSKGNGIKLDGVSGSSIALDKVTNADVYDGMTATTADGNVNKSVMIGNINVTTDSGSVSLASGTTAILYNADANGNFVSNKKGTTDVSVGDGANLTLAGVGKAGAIDGAASGNGVVSFGHSRTGETAGTVTVESIGATNGVASVTVARGDVVVNGKAEQGQPALKLQTQKLSLAKGTSLKAVGQDVTVTGGGTTKLDGNLTAGKLVFSDANASASIANGALVDVGEFSVNGTGKVSIGTPGVDENNKGTSGTLDADKLTLGGATLFVDPALGSKAAIAAVEKLSDKDANGDAQVLDGKIIVGMNSAVGVGFAGDDKRGQVEQYLIDAELMDPTSKSFKADVGSVKSIKSALILKTPIKVASGNGVVVSSAAISTTPVTANKFELGTDAGLIINDSVYGLDGNGAKTGSAVTLETKGDVAVGTGSKIILTGDFDGADDGIKIFDNVNAIASGIVVTSANGILSGELDANGKIIDLKADDTKLKGAFATISEPVRELLKERIVNSRNTFDKSQLGAQFLGKVANDILDTTGIAADAAAHAATYAGAQQAAVVSVTTMADAMFGRVGAVGVEAASIAATGSQANGGVWLTPMYKSMDSDGFNAQGASYGSDVDAAGVAFGADTVNGNMRFGAVFNIGSGDAEGKGNGNGLKDEFDYYGFGIYSAMGFGNFALVGDASMTVVSHDVEGFGLRGKADTTAVTMGITGQYSIATPVVDVTPHLGARFIRLNTDSYDLISADGVLATTDFDVQNVFSVPLGVTLSKAFVAGGWSLAPSADLTLTFNTGDTEAKSTTTFTGAPAIGLNTEVLDEVTYGLTVGLGAQYGAFGTSFGINYTGSSNTDSFGVNAQCRYMF